MGNGLRLLLAARKSRKAAGEAKQDYERQDFKAKLWAEEQGHVIVGTPSDTVSSQTAPWKRKNLKPWMTDAALIDLYDGILISDTDRLSRGDDADFHYIEHWALEHGKCIIVASGPQFPPREGAYGEADRYQWVAEKRKARTYWESVRDKHADTREVIRANGGAIGIAPFGYIITGVKLHKTFTIDPVWGDTAREVFQRIADGHTATSVAIWMTEVTGKAWRVKRVTDMIQRRTYLGERDGHKFEALVSQELFDQANSAMASRSFSHKDTGGRRAEHGYSGLIFCECGAQYYHHQSTTDGKPVGQAKYRCGRGRRGDVTESRCEFGAPLFDDVNQLVDRKMSGWSRPEYVQVTTGGDHGRQMDLARIDSDMQSAMARKDMAAVTKLAAEYSEVAARQSEPIQVSMRETGKSYGDMWKSGNLSDRRSILGRADFRLMIKLQDGNWTVILAKRDAL
jgi:Resolvase, N terminal domain